MSPRLEHEHAAQVVLFAPGILPLLENRAPLRLGPAVDDKTKRLAAGVRMSLFFVLQLPPLWLERRLAQSGWPSPARRLLTLGWLALCSPLFVEPMLDILAGGFDPRF